MFKVLYATMPTVSARFFQTEDLSKTVGTYRSTEP
jgi:hypothetical protein